MLISNGDLLLTALFSIGLFQFFWLSVVLVRKSINPSQIRTGLLILLSIWILIWPAYDSTSLPLLSLSLLCIPLLFAYKLTTPFARHLKLAWHSVPQQSKQPAPWLVILLSLGISAGLFRLAPELGLGLTLSLCLAWHAADLIDQTGKGKRLGLLKNPKQTLAGHLILVLATSLLSTWSLQLYHGIAWHQFFISTLIIGLVASIARAIIATGWNMPVATLAMATALWLL